MSTSRRDYCRDEFWGVQRPLFVADTKPATRLACMLAGAVQRPAALKGGRGCARRRVSPSGPAAGVLRLLHGLTRSHEESHHACSSHIVSGCQPDAASLRAAQHTVERHAALGDAVCHHMYLCHAPLQWGNAIHCSVLTAGRDPRRVGRRQRTCNAFRDCTCHCVRRSAAQSAEPARIDGRGDDSRIFEPS